MSLNNSAVIAAAASGDNTVVAAVAGKKITVHSYVMVAAGTVASKWKTGATDKSGAMTLVANTGVSAPSGSNPWFQGGVGEALILNNSLAIAVNGHLVYSLD